MAILAFVFVTCDIYRFLFRFITSSTIFWVLAIFSDCLLSSSSCSVIVLVRSSTTNLWAALKGTSSYIVIIKPLRKPGCGCSRHIYLHFHQDSHGFMIWFQFCDFSVRSSIFSLSLTSPKLKLPVYTKRLAVKHLILH